MISFYIKPLYKLLKKHKEIHKNKIKLIKNLRKSKLNP